jgi:hypothetical protein
MHPDRLVTRLEFWLSEGAVLVLVLGLALRSAYNWLMTRDFGLFDAQLVLAALLMGFIYGGCLVPRRREWLSLLLLGGLAWLVALSTLFWNWWYILPLREYRAGWHFYAAALVVALGLTTRAVQRQRALRTIGRHGHRWIIDWAAGQPVLLRLQARRVLRLLGYRGPL